MMPVHLLLMALHWFELSVLGKGNIWGWSSVHLVSCHLLLPELPTYTLV